VNYTCFLYRKEFLLSDAVFVRIQWPRVGENRGGTTCVDVMDDSVERYGSGGAGPQQHRKFLEQLLYLGWESSDRGGGRVSFETSLDSKQPKLEPKLVVSVVSLLYRNREFRLNRNKQKTNRNKKERKNEHLFIFFRLYMFIMDSTHIRLRIATHCGLLLRLIVYTHVHHDRVLEHLIRG
jgi:hypothetical protein